MKCMKCKKRKSEFQLLNKKNFLKQESDYISLCGECLEPFSQIDPSAILLLPSGVINLRHHLQGEYTSEFIREIKNAIDITDLTETILYKFEVYIGVKNNNNDCIVNCNIEQYINMSEETKITELRFTEIENCKKYTALYSDLDHAIIGIFDLERDDSKMILIRGDSLEIKNISSKYFENGMILRCQRREIRDCILNITKNQSLNNGDFFILPVVKNKEMYTI